MNRIAIGLINACGINTSLDEITLEGEKQDLQAIIVTESRLKPLTVLPTHWHQQHTFGEQRGLAYVHFGGISSLITPQYQTFLLSLTQSQYLPSHFPTRRISHILSPPTTMPFRP